MKKLLGCFLCVMLLVFGVVSSSSAITINVTNLGEANPYQFLGGTQDSFLIIDTGHPYLSSPTQQDNFTNVNSTIVHNRLNHSLLLPDPVFLDKIEFGDGAWSGTWNAFSDQIDYISLKAGSEASGEGFVLYWIDPAESTGVWSTDWDLDKKDISHISFWGTQSVPEPATMFLLGTGLIGLALFGRQRFKK